MFVFVVIRRGPHVVQIETSVDKKTLIRDSLFIGIARVFRRRIILRSHGGVFDLIPTWSPAWRWFAKTTLGGCDHVVLLARQTKLEFDGFMKGRVQSTVIPNAIDPALTVPNEVRGEARGAILRLVTAGRLISTKGVEDVVVAMSRVTAPGVTLTIFGDGPSTPDIKRLIGELGLEERVFLRGVVPERELPPFYQTNADVFVFPSSHREGFPMAFFTALACGLGAIATRVRPLPDYLQEPTHCLWIEPHDPGGLARQIGRLCAEPGLLAQQRHANPTLTRQFTPDRVAISFLELYEGLLPGTHLVERNAVSPQDHSPLHTCDATIPQPVEQVPLASHESHGAGDQGQDAAHAHQGNESC